MKRLTDKEEILKLSSRVYKHHFDINLTHSDVDFVPSGYTARIIVNAISNNDKPYAKLSDIDGDGYIISAFGMLYQGTTISTAYVLEAKLFYKELNGGTLLINVNTLANGSVSCIVAAGLNDYVVYDSVSKI